MYAEESNNKTRTAHHIDAIALTYQLLPVVEYVDIEEGQPQFDVDLQLNGQDLYSDFALGDIGTAIDDFSTDVENILNDSLYASLPLFVSGKTSLTSHSDFSGFEFTAQSTPPERSSSFQQTPIPSDISAMLPSMSTASVDPQSPSATTSKYRCHCGYVPTGEERWKPSNLSRHKRIQHPEKGGKVYKCQWDGCGSTFTRSDNLKEHVRKKGHDVCATEGERKSGNGESNRKRRKKEINDEMDTALR